MTTRSINTQSDSQLPIRFVVHHWMPAETPGAPSEEAVVSYSTALDTSPSWSNALMMAINTASRYFGAIYADYGDGPGKYTLVRRYAKGRDSLPVAALLDHGGLTQAVLG